MAEVMDELAKAIRTLLSLSRVDLIPEIPSEERAAPTPTLDRKGKSVLDGFAGVRAQQEAGGMPKGSTIPAVVRVMLPVQPGPERVERCEEDAQADALAELKKIVPELHHAWHKGADGALDVAVPHLSVLQHQPQACDAMLLQVTQVCLDGWQVPPLKEPFQLNPADCIVLTNRGPGLTRLCDEVWSP